MTGLSYLIGLHELCRFQSTERSGAASNSELRRWLDQGVVVVNSETLSAKEAVDFPIFSLVLFPKSQKRRTTLV